MPYASHSGTKLYWEEEGSGEPMLMVMGLSFTLDMWFRVRPALAARYRLILMDNRGVGRSDAPKGPYTMRQMAGDAEAVMNAAGVSSAYVIGASMGGMIAQELALQHPARVRALLLGCTTCGMLSSKLPRFRDLAAGLGSVGIRKGKTRVEGEWQLTPLLYADSTARERIAEDIAVRMRYQQTPRAFLNQFAAILGWTSYRRLPAISVPTLVMHGDQDRLVPIENGLRLAGRIPGGQFVKIPAAGHIFNTDQPDLVDWEVQRFLASLSAKTPTVPGRTSTTVD